MLKPHDIFARMSPEVAAQLFSFVFEKEKPLYKATIDSLAKQRKLRPSSSSASRGTSGMPG
jgi:hypothetical protein